MTESMQVAERGISQANKRALRNPWVVGWIALVVVVLSVNIFMITMAFVSNPGLVTEDAYEKGRSYERTVQSRIAAREALGWDLGLESPSVLVLGQPAAFRLTAADKVGLPLTNAVVAIRAYRPSDAGADFSVALADSGAGKYVGDVVFPLKGVWDLRIEVKQGESVYEVTRRVSVLGS